MYSSRSLALFLGAERGHVDIFAGDAVDDLAAHHAQGGWMAAASVFSSVVLPQPLSPAMP
jgi:hypothetical protein